MRAFTQTYIFIFKSEFNQKVMIPFHHELPLVKFCAESIFSKVSLLTDKGKVYVSV